LTLQKKLPGRGLEVQEIWEEGGGGAKTLAIGLGVWIFLGITQCKNILKETLATERFEK